MKLVLIMINLFAIQNTNATMLIIGGQEVAAQSRIAQSTVALVTEYEGGIHQFCSGAIIGPKLILTANHCLDYDFEKAFKISIGTDVATGKLYEVDRLKFYSKDHFDSKHDIAQRDIAIITLKEQIDGLPVQIADPNTLTKDSNLIQAGFGYNNPLCDDQECGSQDKGILYFIDTNKIMRVDSRVIKIYESEGQRIANGDSGGPLFSGENDDLFIYGITSQSSITISSQNTPSGKMALYTSPYHFLSWINCSLPTEHKLTYFYNDANQAECDHEPLLRVDEIKEYRLKLCERTKAGHSIVNGYCWPITKNACELASKNYQPNLVWFEDSKKCIWPS